MARRNGSVKSGVIPGAPPNHAILIHKLTIHDSDRAPLSARALEGGYQICTTGRNVTGSRCWHELMSSDTCCGVNCSKAEGRVYRVLHSGRPGLETKRRRGYRSDRSACSIAFSVKIQAKSRRFCGHGSQWRPSCLCPANTVTHPKPRRDHSCAGANPDTDILRSPDVRFSGRFDFIRFRPRSTRARVPQYKSTSY